MAVSDAVARMKKVDGPGRTISPADTTANPTSVSVVGTEPRLLIKGALRCDPTDDHRPAAGVRRPR
jgi:hypothetical protein